MVYEYPNGTTHVPNASYGTVAFSYPGTQPTGVVSNANGYISYCGPNTQVIVSGATYYNRNFYDLSKIEYQTRNNVTGVWGSRTTLVAGVGFTIPNLTNNYTVYATYTAVSPTTPILTIDALSPTYTGSPIGYGNLFTITVNDASGTNDITSWYDVTGNGNSGLYASYEFSSDGGSTWSSSWPVNAGTYSLRVTLSSDLVLNQTAKNLNGVVQTTTVTINKGIPTPGLPTVNLSYGQTLGGANIINGGGTAGTWTFDTPSITPTLADSGVTNYPATFTPSNSNYNTISQNLKVNVSKATVVVTANDRSQVYGTAPGTYTLNYAGFVMGDTLASVLPTGSVMPTVSCSYAQYSNAGTYPITVSVDGVVADNYNFVAGPNGTLTVNKAPLTVAATAVNRAYIAGNNDVTVNLGSLNGILNNDAVTLASTSVTGTVATPDVGTNKEVTFALPALSGAKALNYTVTCSNLPISVTITKAVPAYTIPDLDSQEYDPDVTLANYSSLLPTGWVWNELTTVPDVQTPVYEATYTPADTNNYQIVVIDVPLEITKAPVLITADNKSTTYGNVEPEFTYAFSGFKGADDENNVPRTGNIVASCDYNTLVPANRNADDYAIVLSGNPESNNYAYTLVDGTLTVNKADLRVKADNKSVVYGSPSPEFTNTYTEDDLVYDEDTIANSVDASGMDFDCSYAVGSNVGTYAIEPNGLVSTNYNFIYTNGVLTVTKATLNVAATNITLPYGSPIPTYTATYTGWVAGDNASNNDLTGSPNFTSPYTSTSPVQVDGYMITVSAGTLSSNNYTFVFTRGYVTVEKATPTVSVWPTATITYLDNLSSPTWDGSEVTSVPGSFVFDSVTTVPEYATGVSYDATFIPTDSNNYNTVQGSVLVIVNKRAISGSLSISGTAMEVKP